MSPLPALDALTRRPVSDASSVQLSDRQRSCLNYLLAMGFEPRACAQAVAFSADVEEAAEFIVNGCRDPLEGVVGARAAKLPVGLIATLLSTEQVVAMGFTRDAAEHAARQAGRDVDACVSFLLANPGPPPPPALQQQMHSQRAQSGAQADGAARRAASEDAKDVDYAAAEAGQLVHKAVWCEDLTTLKVRTELS